MQKIEDKELARSLGGDSDISSFFSMPLSSWGFGMFGRAEKSGEIWGASFADFTEGYSDFAEGYNKIIPISPRATFADWF